MTATGFLGAGLSPRGHLGELREGGPSKMCTRKGWIANEHPNDNHYLSNSPCRRSGGGTFDVTLSSLDLAGSNLELHSSSAPIL